MFSRTCRARLLGLWIPSSLKRIHSISQSKRGEKLKLYEQPVDGYENKFVITEDEAYFVPYPNRMEAPQFIDILGEIFDLDDSEIYREVDGKLFGGRIILGYYDHFNREIIIQTPLETSEYVVMRIGEVFGQ